MSKSIGKIFGTGSTGQYGYENNYLGYLNNYDTSRYDNTLNNMTGYALNMSNNLNNMPQQQFNVDYSDAARQRVENATYQSYVDHLTPQHRQQTADLQNSLVNRGIPVGSQAYQRAMTDLQNSQNNALNQAAYQSVLNGQTAYTQDFNNSLRAAEFNNTARQSYIDQIQDLLSGSVSGYQKNLDLYNLQNGIQNRRDLARQDRFNNYASLANGFIGGLIPK